MRMRKGGTDQGDTLLWLQLCWGLSGHAGSSRLCTHSDPWATASLESQVSLKNIDSLPWGSPEAEILCGPPVVHWCTGETNLLLRVGDDEPFRDLRVSEWMAFLLELQSSCEDTVPWFWSGDAWSLVSLWGTFSLRWACWVDVPCWNWVPKSGTSLTVRSAAASREGMNPDFAVARLLLADTHLW